jgi:glyoxylase I family protein
MSQFNYPFSYIGLDHVVLRCRDLPAMLEFYTQVLGCTLERVNGQLHHLRVGSSLIDLIPATADISTQNMDHVCLRLEAPDWDQISRHLTERGIESSPPASRFGADGVGLSIYLEDPEGNGLELKGSPAA